MQWSLVWPCVLDVRRLQARVVAWTCCRNCSRFWPRKVVTVCCKKFKVFLETFCEKSVKQRTCQWLHRMDGQCWCPNYDLPYWHTCSTNRKGKKRRAVLKLEFRLIDQHWNLRKLLRHGWIFLENTWEKCCAVSCCVLVLCTKSVTQVTLIEVFREELSHREMFSWLQFTYNRTIKSYFVGLNTYQYICLNIGLIMVPMVKPILQTLLWDLWLPISSWVLHCVRIFRHPETGSDRSSWVTLLWQAAQCDALQRSVTQTCISFLLEKLGRSHCCKQVASRKPWHTSYWRKSPTSLDGWASLPDDGEGSNLQHHLGVGLNHLMGNSCWKDTGSFLVSFQ